MLNYLCCNFAKIILYQFSKMGLILLTFFTSLALVLLVTPSIISIAKHYHLFDFPGEIKVHTFQTPRLGGMAIFAAFLFSFFLWKPADIIDPSLRYLIFSLVILFFVGLKDDIVGISPLKKLGLQILVAVIVVADQHGSTRLTSMHGLFNVFDIPAIASIPLTLFTIIVVTNAFNLIDGIDGLASGLGLIACSTFGFWFYAVDYMLLATLSFAMAGALLGILVFNFAPARIFSGDCGSLLIGFIVSMLAIKFTEINREFVTTYVANYADQLNITGIADSYDAPPLMIYSSPSFAVAVIIIPLYDTFRSFTVRILNRKSPFKGDMNHIHHRMMSLGMNASRVCLTLFALNLLFIATAFSLRDFSTNKLLPMVAGMAFGFDMLLLLLQKMQKNALPANQ